MTKNNVYTLLKKINSYWEPAIIGELNEQYVKIAKLKGEFVWHSHENEDEMFFVIKGHLIIEFRDKTENLKAGDYIIIPKGIEHKPIADEEVHVMLYEPKSTINTGEHTNQFTKTPKIIL